MEGEGRGRESSRMLLVQRAGPKSQQTLKLRFRLLLRSSSPSQREAAAAPARAPGLAGRGRIQQPYWRPLGPATPRTQLGARGRSSPAHSQHLSSSQAAGLCPPALTSCLATSLCCLVPLLPSALSALGQRERKVFENADCTFAGAMEEDRGGAHGDRGEYREESLLLHRLLKILTL